MTSARDRLRGVLRRLIWSRKRSAAASSHIPPRLDALPTELVVAIADYLAPQDRASWALSCKSGLRSLGTGALQIQEPLRMELLQRLERDGASKGNILCLACKTFHSPDRSLLIGAWFWDLMGTWFWEGGLAMRPCAEPLSLQKDHSYKLSSLQFVTPNLPPRLHFNTISAIMRSHRHHWDSHVAESLNASSQCRNSSEHMYPRMHQHMQCRIANGRLIMETEKRILPYKGLEGFDAGCLANLLEYLQGTHMRDWICAHMTWSTSYPSVFTRPLATTHSWRSHIWMSRELSRSAERAIHREIGHVQGCTYCYTDFAIQVGDMPDRGGRVIYLRTWKDLGGGESLSDLRWRSHLFQDSFPLSEVRIVSQAGQICSDFKYASTPGGMLSNKRS
ncbi:hypothetical protein HIM_00758 [Hirsutella minnesotensis 3608]|nr:hypothetical protein HIM_00758 [Hirsutella minnesotensis 3608]